VIVKRRIITLCGSTRFKKEFEEAEKYLTLSGNIILTVGCFGHADNLYLSDREKQALDELHRDKILMSDLVIVINKNGYVGDSTRAEIEFAQKRDIPVGYYYGETVKKEVKDESRRV